MNGTKCKCTVWFCRVVDNNSTAPGTSNISVQTELLPNEISLMSATITWSNPTNTIYNITNYNFLLNSPDQKEFHFNQTSANLRSVILKPLSITSEYDFYVSQILKCTVCKINV